MLSIRPSAALNAATALAAAGHDVTLVTASPAETDSAVRILTAGDYPPVMAGVDETGRHLTVNIALFERAAAAAAETPDIIHAFGDSVAHAAISLRRAFAIPLVATPSRSNDPLADRTGPWLAADAGRVIVASKPAAQRAQAMGATDIQIVRGGRGYAQRLEAIYRAAIRDSVPLHAVTPAR